MLMKYALSECYLILEICHFFFLVDFSSSGMAEFKKKDWRDIFGISQVSSTES